MVTQDNGASPLRQAVARLSGVLSMTALFSCAVNLLMLTGPLFMLQVYDRVLASRSVPTLVALAALAAGLYAFMGVLEAVRGRVLVRVGAKLDEALRGPAFSAVLRYNGRDTAVGTEPLRDLETVRQFTAGPGPFAFFDMPWIPVYMAVLFLFHGWLGWFAVAAGILLFLVALLTEWRTARPFGEAARAVEKAQAFAEEGRRGADTIRALGMQTALARLWERDKQEALTLQGRAGDRAGLLSSLSKTLRMIFQSGMLGLGAWLAIRQEITPGTMIAASILMGRALAPLDQAIGHWRGIQAARRSWRRLGLLLSQPVDERQRTALPDPKGQVEVKGVTAWPAQGDKPIVQNMTFALEPGDGLGIIGPSGAGKTTLAKALLGVWPKMRGEVRLDGATLDQWEPVALGRHLGYLPQEASLFTGTVAQNIARFDEDISAKDVVAATEAADVHRLILSLPEGYDTQIGPGGQNLSAGQRQRIALARAIYRAPRLILLDEPNANLDAEGDEALRRAIETMRGKGSTVIVIAHRPSAIAALDKLLVLQNGQQAAFGPKDEVLRATTRPVAATGAKVA